MFLTILSVLELSNKQCLTLQYIFLIFGAHLCMAVLKQTDAILFRSDPNFCNLIKIIYNRKKFIYEMLVSILYLPETELVYLSRLSWETYISIVFLPVITLQDIEIVLRGGERNLFKRYYIVEGNNILQPKWFRFRNLKTANDHHSANIHSAKQLINKLITKWKLRTISNEIMQKIRPIW